MLSEPIAPVLAPTPPPVAIDRPSRIVALDGLRGVAISFVLVHHYVTADLVLPAGVGLGWRLLHAPVGLAWSGVTLFFVLSGFLIGGILMDHRGSPGLMRTFYLRRALRILPLYFAVLAVCALLFTLRANGVSWLPGPDHAFPWWVYAGFLVNFAVARGSFGEQMLSPTWSLSVEEQFYLVAPWVMLLVPDRFFPWLFAGLVALAVLFRLGLYAYIGGPNFGGHVLTPACMDALAAGMFVAWLVRSSAARKWLDRRRPYLLAGLGLTMAGVLALNTRDVSLGSLPLVGYGYTLLVGAYALLLLAVVHFRPPALLAVLSLRWLVGLGRIAYGVYLGHMLVLVVVLTAAAHWPLSDPLLGVGLRAFALAVTLALAGLSWRYFENPLVRLGRRHAY